MTIIKISLLNKIDLPTTVKSGQVVQVKKYKIDQMVYKLYGLTPEEINIVEKM